ncbi:MAG: response regulator [Vicinamibacteria bacterium]|nr:response regulator [Vicinamibacteria bacterium]
MTGQLQVLLVEDDPDHAELIQRGFDQISARVRLSRVPDGESALDYLFRRGSWAAAASSPRPHLVLLDLRLPRLDGFRVLEAIKTDPELRPIPTVILTTSDAESDVARAYAHYANSYLVKPGDFGRLVALVAEIEGYWLDWNRNPAKVS